MSTEREPMPVLPALENLLSAMKGNEARGVASESLEDALKSLSRAWKACEADEDPSEFLFGEMK